MVYMEYIEAIAAIAHYKATNPYMSFADKVRDFGRNTLSTNASLMKSFKSSNSLVQRSTSSFGSGGISKLSMLPSQSMRGNITSLGT